MDAFVPKQFSRLSYRSIHRVFAFSSSKENCFLKCKGFSEWTLLFLVWETLHEVSWKWPIKRSPEKGLVNQTKAADKPVKSRQTCKRLQRGCQSRRISDPLFGKTNKENLVVVFSKRPPQTCHRQDLQAIQNQKENQK